MEERGRVGIEGGRERGSREGARTERGMENLHLVMV